MPDEQLYAEAASQFRRTFGSAHAVAAYAPGRIEVLGNHTDYNEGFVLSAAIDAGTLCLAAPSGEPACRLAAPDLRDETVFDPRTLAPAAGHAWANYVKGVLAGLIERGAGTDRGFVALIRGSVPLGAGLSSSASLEVAAGLALARLYGMELEALELARIGQAAEHRFVGVKCGLLDQISSLFGRERHLVLTDFRDLSVRNVPLGDDAIFLMCNTHARHALVDGEYNERRCRCEEAAAFFDSVLDRPVSALRDVTRADLERHAPRMDPVTARRAAHIVGENERVIEGKKLLAVHDLAGFGKLMYESHASSRENFENSCPELDFIVETAAGLPGVFGARLSGGGFGGSAVVLAETGAADAVEQAIEQAYAARFGQPCDVRLIVPSNGAQLLDAPGSGR